MPAASTTISERKEYFQRVLAPAVAEQQAPDLFSRYGLDIDEDDDQVIARQIDFAFKLWRNTTSHEKYGDLVSRLLREHPDAQARLTDRAARHAARARVLADRQGREHARLEDLESAIADLKRRDGSLAESSRGALVELGKGCGLSEQEIDRRLARERFVDDIGATRKALAKEKHAAVSTQLASLRGLAGDDVVGPTLFSFIGAQFSASQHDLMAHHERAVRENDKRRYGDEKKLASRLLVNVRLYLIDGDPSLYRNAVITDVKDQLRGKVHRRRLVDGRLDASAFQALLREAASLGLDEKWAQIAVQELARAEHLPLEGERQQTPPPTPRPSPPPRHEAPRPVQPVPPVPPRPPPPPPPPPPADGTWGWMMLFWFACFPGGPSLFWFIAARMTRRWRYAARAIVYLGVGAVVDSQLAAYSPTASARWSDGHIYGLCVGFLGVWVIGMIDVWRNGDRVIAENRARRARGGGASR